MLDTTNITQEDGGRAQQVLRVLVPVWFFLLVLALYPYTANPSAPIKQLITGWAAFVLGAVWLYGVVVERAESRFAGPTFAILGAFLGVNLLAAIVSAHPLSSLNLLRPWLSLAVIALVAGQVYRSPTQVWPLFHAVVAAVAVSSMYGFAQRYGLDPFPWSARDIEEYRGMPSTYANPNFAGHTLTLAVLLGLGCVLLRRQWLCVAPLAVMACHLYLTHMRAARVAMAAALVLLLVFAATRLWAMRPARRAVSAVLIVSLLGIGGLLGGGALLLTRTEGALPLDTPSILRLNGYYGAAQMMLSRPLLGFGPGNYDIENIPFWTPFEQRWFATENKKNDHVHNDLLETGVDAGLPGAGLYLLLLTWGLLAALRLAGDARQPDAQPLGLVIGACLAAFAVDGLFGFNLRVPVSAGLFFLLLGVLHGLTTPMVAGEKPRSAFWPTAIITLLALLLGAVGTIQFLAERRFQSARGAVAHASELRQQGDHAGAMRTLVQGATLAGAAARLLPFDARFPELQGSIALQMGDAAAAERALARALAHNPHSPALHVNLAQARFNLALSAAARGEDALASEHLAGAATSAESASRYCPVLAEAEEVLGRIALSRAAAGAGTNAWEEARAHLETALRNGARDWGEVQYLLAQALRQTGAMDAAEAAFRRAAEKPGQSEAFWRDYESFAETEQRSLGFVTSLHRAITRARAGAGHSDAIASLSIRLAVYHAEVLQDTALARGILRELLPDAAERPELWGALALTYADDPLAGLRTAIGEARTQHGDRVLALPAWIAGLADDADGQKRAVETALAQARELRERAGTDAVARRFGWLADLLLHEAEREEVERGARLGWAGELLTLSGAMTEADRVLYTAATILTGDARGIALARRADALAALGRGADALTVARAGAQAAPGIPLVRASLARCLAGAGRTAEARLEYDALLRGLDRSTALHQALAAEAAQLSARATEATP